MFLLDQRNRSLFGLPFPSPLKPTLLFQETVDTQKIPDKDGEMIQEKETETILEKEPKKSLGKDKDMIPEKGPKKTLEKDENVIPEKKNVQKKQGK